MRAAVIFALALAALPSPAAATAEEGCWVSFFDGRNFVLPAAQLRGRSFVESFDTEIPGAVKPELDHVGGEAFFGRVESLVVGPQARLVGYAERNYRDRVLDIGPGRHVPDLADLAFHERVRSFKIFCEVVGLPAGARP